MVKSIKKWPLVSVYIPTFNYGRYIEQAIKSVLNQTYKNWELIIINDGSTDKTDEIINKFENNERITIVKQENKGLTVTSNIALRLSKGKYIIRLDGDDYFDENALLVTTNYMELNPDIDLVYPDYYLIDEAGEIISIERRDKVNSDIELLDMPAHGAGTMFKRKVLLELGGYNEEIRCQDGYDIWIRFIQNYKTGNINLPLFYYRQHENNLTKNKKTILETRQFIKNKYAAIKRKTSGYENIKRLAIIPVRAHSDIEFRLALKKIAGMPLINYTLDEAIKSDKFDRIVLTCEDDEILNHVKENYPDIITIKRPLNYARRNTKLEPTVKYVLEKLKEKFEEIMLLYVETPLRKKEHIIKAIDTMHLFDVDTVTSICETINPHFIHGKYGLTRIGNDERFRLERKNIYEGNGVLLLFKSNNLLNKSIMGKSIGHINMIREDSVRLVSQFDLEIADMLLKKRKKEYKSDGK